MNLLKHLDILSIAHFCIYYVIGLYIKNNYTLILILGILWELFEYYTVRNKTTKNLLYKFWPIPQKYWYDSFEHSIVDISVNMIGYYFGNNSS
jgi:hypothetical protein